jgi:hypothetical protein
MKLSDFIRQLQKLEAEGHGEAEVFYRRVDRYCGRLSSARATDEQDEQGPFDVEPGNTYISVYAGN